LPKAGAATHSQTASLISPETLIGLAFYALAALLQMTATPDADSATSAGNLVTNLRQGMPGLSANATP
jgi:hypothetical protein